MNKANSAGKTKKMPLITFQKILFPANLRCSAMCLKYGQSQPKRANEARAYKKRSVLSLPEVDNRSVTIYLPNSIFNHLW